MKFRGLTKLFKLSFDNWLKHNATRLGAALAFYTIWSIAPLVVLAVSVVALFLSKSAAQTHLLDEVQALMGSQSRDAIQMILAHGYKFSSGVWSTVFGFITLFLGASGVFQELRSDLNDIWEVDPMATSGWKAMLRERLFSFGLVLSVGFVLLVSLLVSAALAAFSKFFGGILPLSSWLLMVFNEVVSLVGIGILFALILKYVPVCRVEWKDVRVGAAITAVLFMLGKTALGFYLGRSSTTSSYGAAASLVVLVIWVYYSAQIFYFGAEFTHVHALANRGRLAQLPRPEVDKKAA
ncbi:MAG: YihY/virulence factor BrkB family protein [Acidobacteriota bacterium]